MSTSDSPLNMSEDSEELSEEMVQEASEEIAELEKPVTPEELLPLIKDAMTKYKHLLIEPKFCDSWPLTPEGFDNIVKR